MALTDESTSGIGATMLVQPSGGIGNYGYPVYMGGGNNGGLFGGGDSWLGILFLIALCNGGFGFGGGYGALGMMNGMLGYDFPWLMTGQQNINTNTNNGFRDQMINDNITSVRDGIAGLSTQLCGCCGDMQMSLANGFAGVNQNVSNGFASTNLGIANGTAAIQNSLCNGFNGVNNSVFGAQTAISQQLNANEIASLNRSFAEQTANTAGFTNVNSGIADLRYTEATEGCATRTAAAQNTRDIIDAQTRGTQAILDKLCALELDGYKRENDNLRTQLNMANLSASQTAQTAAILQGQAAEIDGVYNRLKNCPVGTYNVCNPLTPANGCGCGCGNGFAN